MVFLYCCNAEHEFFKLFKLFYKAAFTCTILLMVCLNVNTTNELSDSYKDYCPITQRDNYILYLICIDQSPVLVERNNCRSQYLCKMLIRITFR